MTENIISRLNEVAPYIAEEDLDEWAVPALLSFYNQKLDSLAYRAYGSAGALSPVAKAAFVERAKAEIRQGLFTFLFKSEHWKDNRDLNTYMLTCLNRLAARIRWDSDTEKKINIPVCPGCKHLGKKEYLTQESRTWSCQECIKEVHRLERELYDMGKDPNSNTRAKLAIEVKLRMHRIFSVHSRTGYRCPECCKFIPESADGSFGISCPYDNCDFFGKSYNLQKMAHPVGLVKQANVSLQAPVSNQTDKGTILTIQDSYAAQNIDPDVEMEVRENFVDDLNVLTGVINDQIQKVKRTNSAGTLMQKLLMYESYQIMLSKYPEEMVSYLVHRKQSSDFPLQARIFQEYARLMQDALPYSIKCGDDIYDVVSLTDPNIQLFSGISEFDATVRYDNTIPNNTTETYTGGRKFKSYGPCFIGMLIDVIDVDRGVSIKEHVDNYSFVQIKMHKGKVATGTKVKVKHFRIIPHYEMGGLVYLQRIRKQIVDSVYYRVHGHKRNERKD